MNYRNGHFFHTCKSENATLINIAVNKMLITYDKIHFLEKYYRNGIKDVYNIKKEVSNLELD